MLRILCLSIVFSVSTPALSGTPDIPDDVNARIARAKSEQAARASDRARARLDDDRTDASAAGAISALDNGCTIAVGNVIEDDKKIGTSAKRETTVIITGDIIQAGNNCR